MIFTTPYRQNKKRTAHAVLIIRYVIDLSEIRAYRRPLLILVRCPDSRYTLVIIKEFRIVRIAEEIDDARNQQHPVIGNLIGIRTAVIFLFELFQKRQKTFDGKRNLVTTFEIHRKSVQSERTGV